MTDHRAAAAPSLGARRLAWSDLAAEPVLPGVSRQTIHGARQTMIRYLYQPGAVFPRHAHPEEQITLVIRGRIAFEIDGERHELGPGDAAVIPGGIPHGAAVVGDEPVETFNALSPRRDVSQETGVRRRESGVRSEAG